jgi:hypothetical protein
MANILGLALKISADASGVQKSLTPVQRALKQLDTEAASVTEVFEKFGSSSAAAAAQQEKFAVRLQALNESLRSGITSPEEYARSFEVLRVAATEAAADLDAAGRIIEANLSREEKAQRAFGQSTAELDRLRDAGLLTEQQYATALQRVSGEYAKATLAADKYADEANRGGDAGVLKFNELSGVLSALPGPIGNVAGRLSGLSSAGEGLSRIFAGGLSQGISGIGASVAGLINPFTAAVAGIAAFGAGAVAVTRGLIDLEDRVERLSRLATQLGVSFEFVQVLEEAGRRADVSVEALGGAFGRLQKTLAGADDESKKAAESLQRLGVSVEDFGALSQEQQIDLIGEKLATIEDPAQRSAAAIALFGKSGISLLPFFRELDGASSDMERFGRAVSELDRQRLADFGGGLDALGVATQGLGQSLLLPFAGLGEGVTTAFAEIIAGITAVVDPIGQVLEPLLSQIGRVIELIGTNLGNLGRVIGAVFEPFAIVVQGVYQAFEPLLDGILDFFKAVSDSAVVVTEWAMSFSPIGVIANNVGVLGDTISRVITIVTTAFSKVGEVIARTLGTAIEYIQSAVASFVEFSGLGPILETIGNVIGSVFGSVAGVFSTIASAIGGTVGRLLTMAENFLGIEQAAESATAGIDGTAESVKELTKDEQKAFDELTKQIERSDEALNGAINKAAEFGQAGFDAAFEFQQALEELDAQAADKELNAEQYARGVANATAEYEKQIESVKRVQEETKKAADEANKAADEAAKRAEADQKRIEGLLNPSDAASKVQEEIAFVIEQQVKAEEELAAARAKSDRASADAAASRLAQLDGLRTKLEDQAQAIDQGFAEGFSSAFDATAASVSDLVDKAGEFGNAGAEAAARLQAGIDTVQEQVRDGVIPKSAYDKEIENQKRVFNERLAQIEETRRKEQEARDAIFTQQIAANERVNAFLNQSTAAEIAAAEEVAARRQQTAFNIEAIEQRLALERQSLEAAREQGDLRSAAAAVDRIDQLKEALTVEQQISEGRQQQIVDQKQLVADQQKFQEEQQKGVEEYQKQQQQAQQAYAAEQAKIFEEQQKAAAAESKRQEERLKALNTLGQQSIASQDVRTTEGANLVLQLSASGQDPSLIQQRLQTKYLEEMNTNLRQAALNYFNSPVTIIGGPPILRPR